MGGDDYRIGGRILNHDPYSYSGAEKTTSDVVRWEGAQERAKRFVEELSKLNAFPQPPTVFYAKGEQDAFNMLELAAVAVNSEFCGQTDTKSLAILRERVPDLKAEVMSPDVFKLTFMDEPGEFTVQPKEGFIKITGGGLTYPMVIGTLETTFSDTSVRPSNMFALDRREDVGAVLGLFKKLQKVVQDARRGSRCIDVYDSKPIPLQKASWSTWNDLFLSEEVIHKVKDDLEFFLSNESVFRGAGLPYKRGYLLCGQPGLGKSSICRTIATSMPFASYMFDFSNERLYNADLTDAFARANKNTPAVFFLEDIDRIYDPELKTEGSNITLDHLLNCLDGIAINDGLVVIATANNPETLDPAILKRPGRFDQVVVLKNPEPVIQRRYLSHLFRKMVVSDDIVDVMVDRTDGMSMAFLKEVFVVTARLTIMAGQSVPTMMIANQALDEILSQYKGVSQGRRTGFRD